jgi:hypothetical protein
MPKRKKHSDSIKFAAVGIGVLFLVAALLMKGMIPGSPRLTFVVPGWEIYNVMGGLEIDTPTMQKLATKPEDFTSPNEISTVYIKGDFDNPYYGFPTIMVTQGGLSHVDFMGNSIPNDQPAMTKSVNVWNATEQKWHTVILDYHIYMYTVTVRTVADKNLVSGGNPYIGLAADWEHETLWLKEWENPAGSGGANYGKEFDGLVWTKLVVSPWRWNTDTHAAPNASYNLINGWAGIMDTYVFVSTKNQVDNQYGSDGSSSNKQPPDTAAKMVIKATIADGNELPMAEDDGTFANTVPVTEWGAVGPDTRIKSSVAQGFPCQLGAGAQVSHDWLGASQDIWPCDVAIQYTVRTDVLQAHDFVLQTGNPPKVTWPTDYFGWSQDFWTSLLSGLNPFGFLGAYSPLAWFIVTLIGIAFIILIVLAVFAPWVLPRIFSGLRQTRDFAFEGTGRKKTRFYHHICLI